MLFRGARGQHCSKLRHPCQVHQELPEDKVTAFRQEETQHGQISACDCRFARHDPITVRTWSHDFTYLTRHTDGSSFRTTAGDLGQMLTSAADRSSDSLRTLRGLGRLLADLAGCVSLLSGTVPAHPWPLCSFSGKEAEARMIVDVFLKRICRKCRLRLSLETPVPASAAIAGKAEAIGFHFILFDPGNELNTGRAFFLQGDALRRITPSGRATCSWLWWRQSVAPCQLMRRGGESERTALSGAWRRPAPCCEACADNISEADRLNVPPILRTCYTCLFILVKVCQRPSCNVQVLWLWARA